MSSTTEAPRTARRTRRTALVGGVLGNAFESYDTAIYGYLAVVMGELFFPGSDPRVRLLGSLALFGVTFFMRPLGALVFGPVADRYGRTRVLVWMIAMMAVATAAVGLLPTYSSVGLVATACLVLLRLVQGLAVGGEFGTATSFLAEYAKPGRRGFVTSFYIFSSLSGFLLGAIVVTAMTAALGDDAMLSWGWRVVFLVAGPLGLLAIYIRTRVEESPEFVALDDEGLTSSAPLAEILTHRQSLAIAVGIGTLHSVAFYMAFSYSATYMKTTADLGSSSTFAATIFASVLALLILPLAGASSDRWGRRTVLAIGAGWLLVVAYPAFVLMGSGSVIQAFVGQSLLGIGVGIFLSTSTATMAEIFPTRIRATGSAVGYNTAAALFGGTAPFIAELLVSMTGSDTSPAAYLGAAALLGGWATWKVSSARLHGGVS